jgi:hypothetical protein
VYTFNNISINVVRIQFTDGSVGYFGPCNTSGSLVYVAQDSEFYSYANYSNSKISVNDYYTAQTAFSGNSNLSNSVLLTQNLTPFSSGTPGIIKIVYYSRGSQKLRFTK